MITLSRDDPDSFVARHKRILGKPKVVVEHCEVRMTDPTVLNFDVYLVRSKRAQGEFERLQFAFGFGRSQRAYLNCFHSNQIRPSRQKSQRSFDLTKVSEAPCLSSGSGDESSRSDLQIRDLMHYVNRPVPLIPLRFEAHFRRL